MAKRLKQERDMRRPEDIVYTQHIDDDALRLRGVDPATGIMHDPYRENLKREDFRDKHGAIDYVDYFAYKLVRGHNEDMYDRSQPDHVHYKMRKLTDHRRKLALEGKSGRWDGYRKVAGFRLVGEGRKRRDRRGKKVPEYTTFEEVVKVKVPNPYKMLGIPAQATLKQAAKSYRVLAKQYHPDAQGGSVAKMAEVNEAYNKVKQIIKEGGPARSATAAAAGFSVKEETVKVKRHRNDRKGRNGAGTSETPVEETIFDLEPTAKREREEMRRMAIEFKSALRGKEHRKIAREETRQLYLDGLERPFQHNLYKKWNWTVFWVGMAGVYVIGFAVIDTSLDCFNKQPVWKLEEGQTHCDPKRRVGGAGRDTPSVL
eukprot:TRINITY_DN20895_c0_g1_i1.p1 TRINITY_DN20895_c0_g1~~TRINITY_DN20895_c0_g1_i1.p1  ORF type:complete len:396 (+),score=135.47 TRINITY_DN20895_c0_g1_i1:75-1190(+)